jgi:catechol 2,3-dioxygenase-like lactoylglutathione lyase family enzyme
VAFFRDALGAEVVSLGAPANPDGIRRITGVKDALTTIAFVRLGDHLVELVEYQEPRGAGRPLPRPCDAGFAHLAVYVDDVTEAMGRTARFGYAPVGEVVEMKGGPDRGSRAVYIRGPEGITLELIGP